MLIELIVSNIALFSMSGHITFSFNIAQPLYELSGCISDRDLTTELQLHALIPLTTDLWLGLKGFRDFGLYL